MVSLWHELLSSFLIAGNNDKVYDKKYERYAKDNTKVHLSAYSDKSVTYVNNNKRLLHVLYCWR